MASANTGHNARQKDNSHLPPVAKWLFALTLASIFTVFQTFSSLNTLEESSFNKNVADPWLQLDQMVPDAELLIGSFTARDGTTDHEGLLSSGDHANGFYAGDDDDGFITTPVNVPFHDYDGDDNANRDDSRMQNTDGGDRNSEDTVTTVGKGTDQEADPDTDPDNDDGGITTDHATKKEANRNETDSASKTKTNMNATPKDTTIKSKKAGTNCSGDVSPISDAESIFNCGSQSGKCHWFYPAKFLNESCEIGKEFIPQVKHMQQLHLSNTLWMGGPPIVQPATSIVPENMVTNKYKDGPWLKHNISMIHVHKTGGSSLVIAFDKLRRKGGRGQRRTFYMPEQYKRAGSSMEEGNDSNHNGLHKPAPKIISKQYNVSSAFVDHVGKYRKADEWGQHDTTMFAVVRDPVDRFISAVGQATGAKGSSANGIGKQLLDECLKETSKKTLNCFIDLVHSNSTWIEVHFTPMLLELSFATFYKDIPLAIFPFEEVPNLLMELGANPNSKRKDGKSPSHRKSEVLTKMSNDDYDDHMLKKLCDIYRMDALFMNLIGMTTKCDPFISSSSSSQ
jgi:hypothetical protein